MSAMLFVPGRSALLGALGEAFSWSGGAFTGLKQSAELIADEDMGHDTAEHRAYTIEADPTAAAFANGLPPEGAEVQDGAATRYRVERVGSTPDWVVMHVLELEEVPA